MTAAKPGDRVRMVLTTAKHTRLRPGAEGTVRSIDAVHTVHVSWDDGSRIGMVEAAGDKFEVINEGSEQ